MSNEYISIGFPNSDSINQSKKSNLINGGSISSSMIGDNTLLGSSSIGSSEANTLHSFEGDSWISKQLSKFNATWLLETSAPSSSHSHSGNSVPQPSILEELEINPILIIYQLYTILFHPFIEKFFSSNFEKKMRKYVLLEDDFWGAALIVGIFSVLVLHKGWQTMIWMYIFWFMGSFLVWFLATLLLVPSPKHTFEKPVANYVSVSIDDLENFSYEENENVDLDNYTMDTEQIERQRVERENKKKIEALQGIGFTVVLSFVGYGLVPVSLADLCLKIVSFFTDTTDWLSWILTFSVRLLTWLHSTYAVSHVLIQVDKANSNSESLLEVKRIMLYWPVGLIFLYFISLH